jgi:hypothetical protein
MMNGSDRLDRIERLLEDSARQGHESARQHAESMAKVDEHLQYMAARQRYHDEAFERFDAGMKRIEAAQEKDGEHIRALVRIAELHHRRLEHLEGGEPA